ncbi:hypothetical protein K7432_017362 [Basidiobolus ranarum]|uniref:Uncharacterized protein n=1 Tax=Basidiobolus ranarum TaxID=34480 RepID=A0ABR2WDG2_9FUNG
MILAAVVGSYLIIHLLGLVFGGVEKRQRGWKVVVLVLNIMIFLQITGMAVIAHLFSTSTLFYVGANYGSCFIFNIISWIIELFAAGFLFVYAWRYSGIVEYEPIPDDTAHEHTSTNPPPVVLSEEPEEVPEDQRVRVQE